MENQKLLIPKTDVVFHALFRKGNEAITKAIISDITKEEIKEIDLNQERYLLQKFPEEKLGILDLKAVLNTGVLCNIEIQLFDKTNTIERILFYWSKIYASELSTGEDYHKLPKTICIAILDYELKELKRLRKITYTVGNRRKNR